MASPAVGAAVAHARGEASLTETAAEAHAEGATSVPGMVPCQPTDALHEAARTKRHIKRLDRIAVSRMHTGGSIHVERSWRRHVCNGPLLLPLQDGGGNNPSGSSVQRGADGSTAPLRVLSGAPLMRALPGGSGTDQYQYMYAHW